jgi:SAM-dependent methyltransferase
MLADTPCEICGSHKWSALADHTYRRADIGRTRGYLQTRLRLLFDLWAQGNDFRIRSVLCDNCGFVMYLPRPEEADLDAKYRYLRAHDNGKGTHIGADDSIENARSEQIWNYISRKIDLARVATVLDFGGMDGRLMRAFVARGKECFVIDYCADVKNGVTKLGETISDIPPNSTFDLIVCSHVIEHVSRPKEKLAGLSRHLSEQGFLFVEVPMEIWKSAPIPSEPVTHINWFTPNSLSNLIRLTGLQAISCELSSSLHPTGGTLPCIRAVGHHPAVQSIGADELLRPDARHYISPSLGQTLRYYYRVPGKLFRTLSRAASKVIPTRPARSPCD